MSDFRADTFDTIDGKHWVWHTETPDDRREVVSLLDGQGKETDDPEQAFGGVVQVAEEQFQIITFSERMTPDGETVN